MTDQKEAELKRIKIAEEQLEFQKNQFVEELTVEEKRNTLDEKTICLEQRRLKLEEDCANLERERRGEDRAERIKLVELLAALVNKVK